MVEQSLLELARQCCDAGNYLDLGRMCAMDGVCWHTYRPGGTLYWFSIPYRFGWEPGALILMNIAAMLVSVLLSSFALQTFNAGNSPKFRTGQWLLLLAISWVLHTVLFLPILFNSLIDGPAAAAVLSGIWLFLLGKKNQSGLLLALAGLFLGLGVWMRAFYLYPLLITMGCYLLCWVIDKQKSWRELLLLTTFLPIFFQFYSTHQQKGDWSFLDKGDTSMWTSGHLRNNFKSYDTILSKNFAYEIAYCGKKYTSVQQTLDNRNVLGLLCFMGERTHFYLGSYAPKTYLMNRHERVYSITFLLVNVLAIILALSLLIKASALCAKTRWFLFVFVALNYGQSLVIVPEQRFVLFPMLMWLLLAVTFLLKKPAHDSQS